MQGRPVLINEKGNLTVMALMVLLVLCVLGTAIISLASMESKMSHYALKSQQAQQAADAGAVWAMEQIWLQDLPEAFNEQLHLGDMIDCQVELTGREELEVDPDDEEPPEKKQWRYQFTVRSEYQGAKKELAVSVVYQYPVNNPLHKYDWIKIESFAYN